MTLQWLCRARLLPVILNGVQLTVILNEAAGVVKDLVERDRPVILNEAQLTVILNEAAGVVKDLVERDRPVILNGVKDLGERNNAFILCG